MEDDLPVTEAMLRKLTREELIQYILEKGGDNPKEKDPNNKNEFVGKGKAKQHVPGTDLLTESDSTEGENPKMDWKAIVERKLDKKERNRLKRERKNKIAERPLDWDMYSVRHVALKIAYLGFNYRGFAYQKTCDETVEDKLFEALVNAKLIQDINDANYSRCGRTDKGVSAFQQVVSLYVRSQIHIGPGIVKKGKRDLGREEINFTRILNRILPEDIRVVAWAPVPDSFAARFSCLYRTYKYYFLAEGMDIGKIREGTQKLLGEHDFRNFCKPDVLHVYNFTRKILEFTVERAFIKNEEEYGDMGASLQDGCPSKCLCGELYSFTICGYAFLWHQVRCMVAILFMVGQGLEDVSIIDRLLDIEKTPRKPSYDMASEIPLVLFECGYEDIDWVYESSDHDHSAKVLHNTHYKDSLIRAAVGWHMWKGMDDVYFPNPACRKRSRRPEKEASSSHSQELPEEFLQWAELKHQSGVRLAGSRPHQPLMKRKLEKSIYEKRENLQVRKNIVLYGAERHQKPKELDLLEESS